MGQRHQLFVIAKINGKYRSLAAVHHQWLYGHTALKRCYGLLRIFSNPKNAFALKYELNFAAKNEELWAGDIDYNDLSVKFPFIMTCLTLGACYNSDDGYLHRVHLEPFGLPYNGGDNNNGITIIDISNLDDVRYCFVDFAGMESQGEVQLMTPLNATIYLEAYYDLKEEEFKIMSAFAPEHGVSEEDVDALVEDVKSMTLRDRSLNKLLETILSGEENADVIAHAEETTSDFWPKMKNKFYEKANEIEFSDETLDLLVKSLQTDDLVDLSPFKKMSGDQVLKLVRRLTTDDYFLLELNVTGLLSNEELRTFLTEDFDIVTVYVSDGVLTLQEIADIHPKFEVHNFSMLRRAFDAENSREPLPVLDFSSSANPVVHVAWLTIPWSHLLKTECYESDGNLKYSALKPVDTSRSRYHWMGGSNNNTFSCRKYPLIDTPMPLSRFVGGLKMHIKWLADTEAKESPTGRMHDAFACALALGASPYTIDGRVGPLSPALYYANEMPSHTNLKPEKDQWALILIHPTVGSYTSISRETDLPKVKEVIKNAGGKVEFDPLKIYYALMSPRGDCSEDGYEVIDIKKYCEVLDTQESAKVLQWWKSVEAEEDAPAFYGFDDVQEMLKSIYSEQVEKPPGKEEAAAANPYPGLAVGGFLDIH